MRLPIAIEVVNFFTCSILTESCSNTNLFVSSYPVRNKATKIVKKVSWNGNRGGILSVIDLTKKYPK
jgi:hypothetical protein